MDWYIGVISHYRSSPVACWQGRRGSLTPFPTVLPSERFLCCWIPHSEFWIFRLVATGNRFTGSFVARTLIPILLLTCPCLGNIPIQDVSFNYCPSYWLRPDLKTLVVSCPSCGLLFPIWLVIYVHESNLVVPKHNSERITRNVDLAHLSHPFDI